MVGVPTQEGALAQQGGQVCASLLRVPGVAERHT